MDGKLFHQLSTSALLKAQAPLPATNTLEGYILGEFPADMRTCGENTGHLSLLARKHAALLRGEANRIKSLNDNTQACLTQLDLMMLLGGYLLAKTDAFGVAPPILLELLDSNGQAHNLPTRMTYEFIVDVNTEAFIESGGNIRVFSDGPIAQVERDFYIGHHFAEQHMRSCYEALRDILIHPQTPRKAKQLHGMLRELQEFTHYMAAYSRLPHQEYAYFRRFLHPYPDKTKNASGAFMPAPQLFELLLQPSGFAQQTYITNNLHYFSRWAQPLLKQAVTNKADSPTVAGIMLADKRWKLTGEEKDALAAVIEQFIEFKLTHIKVAASKIPEAFPKSPTTAREDLRDFHPFKNATRDGAGLKQGTGGFAPQDFLGDGIRRLLDLQQRLSL